MTKVIIIAVHPTVTIVQSPTAQTELPTSWFPETPKIHQEWSIEFDHTATDAEKAQQLNAYLARD